MGYRRDIDGLRALAVCAVVLFHAKAPGFSGGFVGVDVFFVISGFLITGMIANDVEAGRFSFAEFYHRRMRRIVPALLVVYVASVVCGALLMLPRDMAELGRSLMSSALFASNFFFFNEAGYFDTPSDLKPLLHTWSLSIEEQFYLAWPLLVLLVARWRAHRLAQVVWLVGALSVAAFVAMVYVQADAAFFVTPFRAWELMLGAALAVMPARRPLTPFMADASAAAGLILIAGSVMAVDPNHPRAVLAALPACLGCALLIRAGADKPSRVTRLLSAGPAVALGLVSYSLYLWHWPILSFARYALDRPLAAGELGILLAASLAAAFLTYRLVEQPARRLDLSRMKPVIGGGVLALGALALAGQQINRMGGLTFNLDPEIRRLDAAARAENVYRRKCNGANNAFANEDVCTFGRAPRAGSYDMVILGDSHANHFAPTMSLVARAANMSGRQITVGGCLALLGYYEIISPFATEPRCRSLREAMIRFVDENPRLQLVVLAHRWSIYTGASFSADETQPPFYLLGTKGDSAPGNARARSCSTACSRPSISSAGVELGCCCSARCRRCVSTPPSASPGPSSKSSIQPSAVVPLEEVRSVLADTHTLLSAQARGGRT